MSDVMKHPVWSEVETALSDAKAMHWDGCHKIYLSMDDKQVAKMIGWGYESFTPDATLLREWFSLSCALRFVEAVHTVPGNPNDGFEDLIPQGFFDDEDDEIEEDIR